MNDLIVFLIKASISLVLFYTVYWVLLKNLTFYRVNRFFLLIALLFSIIVPWTRSRVDPKVELITPLDQEWTMVPIDKYPIPTFQAVEAANWSIGYNHIFLGLYLFGLVVMLVRYSGNVIRLCSYPGRFRKVEGEGSVYLSPFSHAFSFFGKIYLPESMDSVSREGVITHERAHVASGHSFDRMLIDLFAIVFWFNPIIYYYRNSLISLHEYEADRGALRNLNPGTYLSLLLDQVKRQSQFQSVSYFNSSLIKNRLRMMNKSATPNVHLVRYIVMVPLIACLSLLLAKGQELKEPVREVHVVEPIPELPEEPAKPVQAIKALLPLDTGMNSGIPSILPIADRSVSPRITSGFGKRMDPFDNTEKMHFGIDIVAPRGTPIIATADGQVREAEFQKNGYGNYVWVDHTNGLSTRYAQLENSVVSEGDAVKQGQVVGYLGSSGRSTAPHLHYAVMRESGHVDPMKYIKDYEIKVKSK